MIKAVDVFNPSALEDQFTHTLLSLIELEDGAAYNNKYGSVV